MSTFESKIEYLEIYSTKHISIVNEIYKQLIIVDGKPAGEVVRSSIFLVHIKENAMEVLREKEPDIAQENVIVIVIPTRTGEVGESKITYRVSLLDTSGRKEITTDDRNELKLILEPFTRYACLASERSYQAIINRKNIVPVDWYKDFNK